MEKIIGDYKIIINHAEVDSPRVSEDNLSTMVCFHSKYDLGDDHSYVYHEYDGWDDLQKAIVKDEDPAVILPLYFLDHSGQSISLSPFVGHGWDYGRVGFVFVSKEDVRNEYRAKRMSKRILELATSVLKAEVETYDKYMKGEVYKFKVFKNEELIDECTGFFGQEECLEAALECIE